MHLASPETGWRLTLHGVACWQRGSAPPRPLERKHAALLAWLHLEGPTPRGRLAGLLWPDVPEDRARGNLRQRLLKLRNDAGALVHDDNGILSIGPGVQVQPPDPPGAELLQNHRFDECDALARWLDGRREAERDRRKREWLAEVREAAQNQRLDDALYAADQLLQTDRESEEAYRVLMEVSYLRGDHAAALSAWDRCRDMLRQLYGVQPSAATRQLGDTILAAAQSAQATLAAWAPTPAATRALPVSVLRPPRLVGRDGALQRLQAGWQAGQVLCVAGEAGLGKSRLLGDWAGALGPCALAAARPGDAVQPHAALGRLVLAAAERFALPTDGADALQAARLVPRLASLAGQTGARIAPVRTEHERSLALQALARWLAGAADRGCQALVLDDLQFADEASVAALQMLTEPGRTRPLRWALGLRPDEAGAQALALLDGLTTSRQLTRVDLAALSADDAQALLDSLGLPALDARAWAGPLWRQVGGNPAFLLESVKLLLSSDGPSAADGVLPLPASIEAVIQRRIDLLSAQARHLAQLAAIAGSGYSIPLAAEALACPPIALSAPLRELEQRQVFIGRQFVHDVVATVTARSVPQAVAEFMHRFVAEHLGRHGGDPAQIATHWEACGEWRLAGQCFRRAAQAARAAALANAHAALLDRAIDALARDPAATALLFDALSERASAFESQGHEAQRPAIIARMAALARTEAQQLTVLNLQWGLQVNLGQPLPEAEVQAAIDRAVAAGEPDLAWQLSRALGWTLAMSDRAEAGLALLARNERWIETAADAETRAHYRLARSSMHAFGDRLEQAIAEGRLALAAFAAAGNWTEALPAMSNLGVMHYWRGECAEAHAVLAEARARREALYGRGGAGIKIDIHLGAVLHELGRHAEARAMLEGAVAELRRMPPADYIRTDILLAENHLAQMAIALGQADAAAAALASSTEGLAERWVGRRLALRLRWQRCFGAVDAALVAELQGVVARLASPFNRVLMELELARLLPPADALATCTALHDNPAVQVRPGLQLHCAALALQMARGAGDAAAAQRWETAARGLMLRCQPFDMAGSELARILGAAPGTEPGG